MREDNIIRNATKRSVFMDDYEFEENICVITIFQNRFRDLIIPTDKNSLWEVRRNGIMPQHACLIIENVIIEDDVKKRHYWKAHFISGGKGLSPGIIHMSEDTESQNRPYTIKNMLKDTINPEENGHGRGSFRSGLFSVDIVNNILANIEADIDNPPLYLQSGKNSFKAKYNQSKGYNTFNDDIELKNLRNSKQHNCITWAEEKLEEQGIQIDKKMITKFLNNFIVIPSINTNPTEEKKICCKLM